MNIPRRTPVVKQVAAGSSPTIEQIAAVNAVEGLRDVIQHQEKRVAKLRAWEQHLAYPLGAMTHEMRLLKDMYQDVIRFQTSTAVLTYLRDNIRATDPTGEAVSAGDILEALAERLVMGDTGWSGAAVTEQAMRSSRDGQDTTQSGE